jgi:hypothetical protein
METKFLFSFISLYLALAEGSLFSRFQDWAKTHSIDISDSLKQSHIYSNWLSNDKYINEINFLNLTYALDHNAYSGYSSEEFASLMGFNSDRLKSSLRGLIQGESADLTALPTSIDSFVVYKESTIAGVFNEIGRVDYQDNSEFIDTASLPSVNNNRYRLAIKDSCGNMTTQGDLHGTIKTWITPLGSGDSLEVFFTKYIGIDSLTYTLYRGSSAATLSPVGSSYIFNNNNANFYSIKDLSPPAYSSGYVYYQIRANLLYLCNSDSNMYQQSISNTVSYGNALGIEEGSQLFEVNAFPNPNNGTFNISITTGLVEDINLAIYNQIGELVWFKKLEKTHGKNNLFVPLEHAAQGVYLLKVTSSKKVINNRLIINK